MGKDFRVFSIKIKIHLTTLKNIYFQLATLLMIVDFDDVVNGDDAAAVRRLTSMFQPSDEFFSNPKIPVAR